VLLQELDTEKFLASPEQARGRRCLAPHEPYFLSTRGHSHTTGKTKDVSIPQPAIPPTVGCVESTPNVDGTLRPSCCIAPPFACN
jgi:hypothetical protein